MVHALEAVVLQMWGAAAASCGAAALKAPPAVEKKGEEGDEDVGFLLFDLFASFCSGLPLESQKENLCTIEFWF